MNKIHPLAYVDPAAKLGDNIEIGPFAYVDANTEIGDGCRILNGASVYNHVKMGQDCTIFPGAVVGAIPQDLKFEGEESWVEIGDRVNIRECATVNRGTKASGKGVTRIGSDTLIMSYAHVAHDCRLGDHCIVSSFSGLAGEVDLDDWAIIGGGTMIHQFTHIGAHSMVAGASGVTKDVPPYVLTGRNPVSYAGVNRVGLSRRGFDEAVITEISAIYRVIYQSGYNVSDACRNVRDMFPESRHRDTILAFIESSARGIIR